jgi:hypothetical protein
LGPAVAHLDARDAAVWVLEPFVQEAGPELVAEVMKLPWRLVLSESSNLKLQTLLEATEDVTDPLVRRRGFLQLIDTNPAEVLLPPRSLPIYLLGGRDPNAPRGGLAAMTRRLTMLDALRRLPVKELVILAGGGVAIPAELGELWTDGLRTLVTVVSNATAAEAELEAWRKSRVFGTAAAFIPTDSPKFCNDLLRSYLSGFAIDRLVLRIRDDGGALNKIDVTGLDSPEYPLLSNYELLQDPQLHNLQPNDLTYEETQGFFQDAAISWRPYAAEMPWQRSEKHFQALRTILKRLDRDGSEANRIAYITSESGAGGTTLARMLAWAAARDGYPTLIARAAPFKPKALEVATFITRVNATQQSLHRDSDERLYQAPWLIIFDHLHWDGRVDELRNFLRELELLGRVVCVLVVTGPYTDPILLDNRRFVRIASLSHEVGAEEAIELGRHLNKFLAPHGPVRSDDEWRSFYAL